MSGSPIEILCGEFPRMPRYQIEGFYKGSEQDLELTRKLIRTHLGITIVENLVLYEITDSFDSLIDRPGHLLVEIASDCSMSTGYPKVFKKKFGVPAVGNDLFRAIEPTKFGLMMQAFARCHRQLIQSLLSRFSICSMNAG